MIRASKLSSLKPFLASGVPKLQFDLLPAAIYCFDLEVDPKGGREGGVEGALLGKAEEDAGLAHPRVPYHEQLEEKVIVLGLIHPPKDGLHFSYLSCNLVISDLSRCYYQSKTTLEFFAGILMLP